MNPHGTSLALAGRRRRPVAVYAFTAVLILAAMLLGILAMHSMTGEHGVASGPAESTGQPDTIPSGSGVGTNLAVAAAAAMIPLVASAEVGLSDCADCMLECAVWAMACALLLILATLVVLARSPATYRRLLDAGGRIIADFRGPALHLFRPSLVVLSISRT